MIRNEKEYGEAVRRQRDERDRLKEIESRLKSEGLGDEELQRALDPIRSFHQQLDEEIGSYERLKRGDVGELQNFHGTGRMLIGLRIALGYSQRELAQKLGVDESQVSRDERNEYFGVKVERVSAIFDALGVDVRTSVSLPQRTPQEMASRDSNAR